MSPMSSAPRPGAYTPQPPTSLDMARATSPDPAGGPDSFRRRSASTAALMENNASFLDPVPPRLDLENSTGRPTVDSNRTMSSTSSTFAVDAARILPSAHRNAARARRPARNLARRQHLQRSARTHLLRPKRTKWARSSKHDANGQEPFTSGPAAASYGSSVRGPARRTLPAEMQRQSPLASPTYSPSSPPPR